MSESLPVTVSLPLPTASWSDTEPALLLERLARLPATDRYDVGAEIARGGMGAVHRCRDRLLGRDLAVKVLLPALADRPDIVRRFIEEAQVGGRLQHPGVVPVHELGRLPDGRLFFTMKLVEGQTLAQLLRARQGPRENLSALLKIFEQICQTLAYAHSQGVIHRDLKPANVMVGAFGEVQVMDWGLAKDLANREPSETLDRRAPHESGGSTRRQTPPTFVGGSPDAGGSSDSGTQAGTVLGTLAYMPPEQARGEIDRLDERGDVFGLGAVLCEILTGRPPYTGKTLDEMRGRAMDADLTDALARLDACGADAELIALCHRCLAVEPDDRPRDGRVVAEAMSAYLAGVAERLRQAEIERAASEVRARAERGKRQMTLALAGTVLVVLLLGGGTWFWLREARRARVEQTARAVIGPLDEARSSKQRADRLTPRTLAEWREVEVRRNEALAAGLQAEQALAAGEADDAIRAALEDLLPALRADTAAATRNRAMLDRLHAISYLANDALDDNDFDYYLVQAADDGRFLYSGRRSQAEYAQAFRDFGIDVAKQPPEELSAALDREPIRAALVEALIDWLRLTDPGPERERLDALVQVAEKEPFRHRVLQAARSADRAELLALADMERTTNLPLPLLLVLSDALFFGEEAPAAVALLRRTQTARPGEFWLCNKLGEYLMFTGSRTPVRVTEATRYFTAALVVRPESQVARINLGDALIFLGSHEEAIETYRYALTESDRVFAQTKLAIALAVAGYHEEALEQSQRALKRRPGSAWVKDSRGSVCAMVGRHTEAVEAFRAAIELNPAISSYHSNLGTALTELGQHDQSIAEHREAVRLKPSGTTRASLALALLRRNQTGDVVQAGKAAREGLRLQPESGTALLALASVHEQEKRRDLALERLREAVRIAPHDPGAWWQLGGCLRRDHRLDEATHALQEAIRRGPSVGPRRSNLLRDLSEVLVARSDLAGAIEACRAAIQAMPREAGNWVALGKLLRRSDDQRGAAEAYHEALYLNPDHVEARSRLVELRVEQGRHDEAFALCEDAPQSVSRESRLGLARLLLANDRPEDARRVLSPLATRIKNPDGAAWHLRGRALRQLGQLDDAIGAFYRALEAKPSADLSYVEATLDLADALLTRDNPGDAARGHSYRGWALATSGQPFPAVEAYREATRLDPDEVDYPVRLGETLLKAHHPEAALRAFDDALKIDRRFLRARRGRGIALHDLGKLTEACQALEAAGNDRETTRALAGVLRDLGEFHKAAGLYDRVEDKDQGDTCKRLAALAPRLPSLAGRDAGPLLKDALLLAEAAAILNRPALAARLFDGALANDDPNGDRRLRDLAIASAVRAGCGEGDGKGFDDRSRAALRAAALDRLRTSLLVATQLVARELHPDRASTLAVVGDLRRWQRAAGLAGVREEKALALLPKKERQRWRALWDEVAALLRLAELLHGRNDIALEAEPR